MKLTFLSSAILTLGFSASFAGTPTRSELAPTGRLSIDRALVRTGIKPMINWEIQYPRTAADIVKIGAQGEIIAKERTLMEVRVVGAAFQLGSNHTDLELKSRIGGSSWEQLFLGNDSEVLPNNVLQRQIVDAGTRIDFSARAADGRGGWFATRDTRGRDSSCLQALMDGDFVPNFVPAYDQDTAQSFLRQFISSGNEVTVGPRDVIYLVELYATDRNSPYFDMQDIVVVVSFKDLP
jgi:hypothetical protein